MGVRNHWKMNAENFPGGEGISANTKDLRLENFQGTSSNQGFLDLVVN